MIKNYKITTLFSLILSAHVSVNACKIGHAECSVNYGTEGHVELCIHNLYEEHDNILDESTLWYLEEDDYLDPDLYDALSQKKESFTSAGAKAMADIDPSTDLERVSS